MKATQGADGVFASTPAAMLTWEARRDLLTTEVASDLGKVTIDGPCVITAAYASRSPLEAFELQEVPTLDDILCELNLNKVQQLTIRADNQKGGQNDRNGNAVTLASLTSKDATRSWMMRVPEGQHELTVRYRWRVPALADEAFVSVNVGLALFVRPGEE